jgi:type VI secretion system protein ImpL
MDIVMSFLRNKFAVSSTLFLLICVVVLYIGEFLEWSYMLRAVIILVALLIIILFLFIKQRKEDKKAQQLEKSLKAQADAQMFGAPADKKAELEELSKKFTTAVETLKASKLSQGQKGNAALYALPWYLIVGPPAAGKTTMIQNSGLDFPLEAGRVRGVGGTRDCDWFFSNSAIFLDTAGRYTTEESDGAEWMGFLDLLKKYRPQKPLNGVMVGISITDLMGKTEDVEYHAVTIRKRLDELITRLGVHFPVYLVFTKCDLVQGCVEFFSDLNARETEQIWGYTLTTAEQNSREHGNIFRTAYKKMLETLENIRLTRLNAPINREERRKIYSFPDEMAVMRDSLTTFVNRLFQHNPFHENPIFRGFYFTSGTQEGVPVDQVIQSIARQYNLPNYGANEFPESRETKSYFIKDLFNQVIIHDQRMVTTTAKADKARGSARMAAVIGSVLALCLFIFGVGCGYRNSQQTLANLQSAVEVAKLVKWSGPSSTEPNLRKLDELRQRIRDAENESGLWTLGMSRGGSTSHQAKILFFRKFKPIIEEFFYKNLEFDLTNYASTGADSKGVMEGELGAYILFGADDRMAKDADPPKVSEGKKHLQDQLIYLANLSFMNRQGQAPLSGEMQQMVREQLKLFAETIRDNEPLRFNTSKDLVSRVRAQLRNNLTAKSLYNSIKLQIINTRPKLGAIGLRELLGRSTEGFIFSDSRVNGFFTRAAWDSLVVVEFRKRAENPAFGNWIIGRITKEQLPANLKDSREYLKSLVKYYFEEYSRIWVAFLQSVQYDGAANSGNPLQAAMRLNELSAKGSSPYLALIDSISAQNRLKFKLEKGGNWVTNQYDNLMGNATGEVNIDQSNLDAGQSMKAIHELSSLAPQGKNGLQPLLEEYFKVAKELERLAATPGAPSQPVGTAILMAKDVAERVASGFDAGTRSRVVSSLFHPPLDAAGQASTSIIAPTIIDSGGGGAAAGGAAAAGGGSGAAAGVSPLQAAKDMQSFYPFNSGSNTDVSAEDFAAVFKPGGSLDQYFDSKKDVLTNPQLASTPEVQKLISFRNDVAEIQKAFFSGGNLSASYSLVADRPEPSGVVAEVDVKLDATKWNNRTSEGMSYEVPKTITWPGDGGEAFIAARDVSGSAEDKVSAARGAFSMFRLLEKGGLKSSGNSEFAVAWRVNLNGKNVTLRYTIQANGMRTPLSGLGLLHGLKIPN